MHAMAWTLDVLKGTTHTSRDATVQGTFSALPLDACPCAYEPFVLSMVS